MTERKIMLVDDDENIIKALQRSFFDEDFTIITASNGQEALQQLTETPVPVIISDMRMPVMNGADFFSKVKDIYPDTIRIILSGYSEISMFHDLINNGGIWRFIPKPWNDENLKLLINEAFDYYNIVQEKNQLVSDLQTLNQQLDHKVEEKTKELAIHNSLLTKILNIHEYDRLFLEFAEEICRLKEIRKCAIFSGCTGKIHYSADFKNKKESALSSAREATEQCKIIIGNKLTSYPIFHEEEILGSMVIQFESSNEHSDDFIDSLLMITSIALNDEKSIENSGSTLEKIDTILGSMQ